MVASKTLFVLLMIGFSIETFAQLTSWTKKADMPTARGHAHAITVGSRIFVLGGDNSGAVEVFTPKTNSWEIKKSFPGKELNWSGAGLIDDNIYAVIGIGERDHTRYHVIARYNIKTDEWTRLDSTQAALNDPGVAVAGKSIYIIGGFTQGINTWNSQIPLTNLSAVKEYNIETRQWSTKKDIPTKRHTPQAVVINSRIYVFGGVDETFSSPPSKKVEVFDPQTNSWSTIPDMINGMAYFRAAIAGGNIYFPYTNPKKVIKYNITSENWTYEQQTVPLQSYFACAALNNVVYAFGGTTYQNNTSTPLKEVYSYAPEGMVKDYDGNLYSTVKIGEQTWLRENLKSVHYADGTPIEGVHNNTSDSLSEIYGRFYSWAAASRNSANEKMQGACPNGWHIPSDYEWTVLENYLGGNNSAGAKLKETGTLHWKSPNSGATNESGFTALPGGFFAQEGVTFSLGDAANLWTSTQKSATTALIRIIAYKDSKVIKNIESKLVAFSVRAIMDSSSTSGINDNPPIKTEKYQLMQNYPNPFNPVTTISYSLQKESFTELKVYDMLGREVSTLVSKEQNAGEYKLQFDASSLTSGVYMYAIMAGDFRASKKLLLIK